MNYNANSKEPQKAFRILVFYTFNTDAQEVIVMSIQTVYLDCLV